GQTTQAFAFVRPNSLCALHRGTDGLTVAQLLSAMITSRTDGLAVLTLASQAGLSCVLFLIWTEAFIHWTPRLNPGRPPYLLCFIAIVLGLAISYRRTRSLLPLRGKWQWNTAF